MASKDGFFKENALGRLGGLAVVLAMLMGPAGATEPASGAKAAKPSSSEIHKVTTPAERCSALERQFDTALLKGAEPRGLSSAKKLRAEGAHLCESGRHAAGALRLSRALADLGLDPKEP